MTKLRPGLSGNPFFAAGKAWQKRLGTEDGKVAIIKNTDETFDGVNVSP